MVDHAPPPEDSDGTLKPPQFTLRTLLIAMTALACLLAVMTAIGSWWSMAVLLVLALVSAHVAGNALGTKLRNHSARRRVVPSSEPARRAVPRRDIASPQRLTQRTRLHWMTLVMSGGGALAGGYFGGSALAANYPEATTAAVMLGVVSSGVLGALAGFTASSFLEVVRQALSEAHAASDTHKPRAVRRPPK